MALSGRRVNLGVTLRESGTGHKRTFAATPNYVRFRGLTGHRMSAFCVLTVLARPNVRYRGQSGRFRATLRTSAYSQKRTFVRALEVRNQVIGWPRKGCASNGGGTLVQFP